MMNPLLVPTGARRLARVFALVFPIVALAPAVAPPWMQQQELNAASDGAAYDYFGIAVSVSGDTAVIGASGANVAGAAYVFVRSGTTWSQQQELTASDGAADDQFGLSVALSGDTAVIGASAKNRSLGAAYVFVRSGTTWSQQQELTASDGAAYDSFGESVSVSGDTTVIGAVFKGAAYVFVRSGTTWSQQQELTASDAAANDQFGVSAAISGDTAVIGANAENFFHGAAYIFVGSGGEWSQEQELTASDGGGWFGYSVSVSEDTAVTGAHGKAIGPSTYEGAAYVFVGTQPTITGVRVSGGGASIAQNAWVEIYGSNLAPASVGTGGLTWSNASSFEAGQMPTELQGISVTVDNKPAYTYYVSPVQVNVLAPLDPTIGLVTVTVNNGSTASAAFTVNLEAVSPGFLRISDGIHIAAEHAGYSLLGPASMSVPGYTFTPATPGETILPFGDGFGLPVTTLTAGSEYQSGALPMPWPQVTIGGTTATVQYAGLISPGLYQINVTVPLTAATGDNQVIATYGGATSPTGAMIPVSP